MQNILVTGGLGYIGSHVSVKLANLGYHVTIVDDLSNSNIDVLESIRSLSNNDVQFIKIDLTDFSGCYAIFSMRQFDAVIHCAALSSAQESINFPATYYSTNFEAILNVLHSMEEYSVKNLLYVSSAGVYGEVDELNNIRGRNKIKSTPLGMTHRVAEEMIKDHVNVNTSLQCYSVRTHHIVGSHTSCKLPHRTANTSINSFDRIVDTVLKQQSEFVLESDDRCDTTDGSIERNYLDVNDLVDSYVVLLEEMLNDVTEGYFKPVNLSAPTLTSDKKLIRAFNSAFECGYYIVPVQNSYEITTTEVFSYQMKSKLLIDEFRTIEETIINMLPILTYVSDAP